MTHSALPRVGGYHANMVGGYHANRSAATMQRGSEGVERECELGGSHANMSAATMQTGRRLPCKYVGGYHANMVGGYHANTSAATMQIGREGVDQVTR